VTRIDDDLDGRRLSIRSEVTSDGPKSVVEDEIVDFRSPGDSAPDRVFTHVARPTLRGRRPVKPNGAAMIVVPGGGFQRLVIDKGAADIEGWLLGLGITVLTLTHRLPIDPHENPHLVAFEDGRRAVRFARANAVRWGLDPNRVGMLGFSSGAFVAGTVAVHHRRAFPAVDETDRVDGRPDLVILGYTWWASVPDGTPEATLNPAQRAGRELPIASAVDARSAPALLFHAEDDEIAPAANAIDIHAAYRAAGVPSEIHLYATGGHGFCIRDARGPAAAWPADAAAWLRARGFADPAIEAAPDQ